MSSLRLALAIVVGGFALTIMGWVDPVGPVLLLIGAFSAAIAMESMIAPDPGATAAPAVPLAEPTGADILRRAA